MKLLIAEDDLDMQKIIVLYLKKEGYDVVTASDGNQALELIYENKFDLVILDWMMPYTDGIDVCMAIRELGIQTKVLMLTAKDTTENEITGLSCGADDYMRKPFDFKLLLLRIKKLLPEYPLSYAALSCCPYLSIPDLPNVFIFIRRKKK